MGAGPSRRGAASLATATRRHSGHAGCPFDDSAIFSYGHRKVEGLAFDDAGALWASEFGDDADELNAIVAGGNYGWPIVEVVAVSSAGRLDTRGLDGPTELRSTAGNVSFGQD